MSYADQVDLEVWIDDDVLIRLTDDGGLGVVDSAVIDSVLEAASLEIDGYLGGRYTLPLSPEPPILKKLCVDIGGYLLHIRRDTAPGDYWEGQYENAIAFLTKIGTGKITLGAADPQGSGSGHSVTMTGPDRVFDRDKLKGY
ncbi:MAG TPA: DUF1320 domain-containing protein [Desulfobulbaceae bacterium]|nr:DUF1320 domain-containing protein [Desulfobulbaceae bacterium]